MDIKGKTVLVTGGAGLIGSNIVDQLLAEGCKVKILDNLESLTHPRGKPDWVPLEVEFFQGDVASEDIWEKPLEGADLVFHEAAFGGFLPGWSKYFFANVIGTARLFEAIKSRNLPIQKIVVASSQAVYGEGAYRCAEHGVQYPDYRPVAQLEKGDWEVHCPICGRPTEGGLIPETKPLDATAPYSISKLAEEKLALSAGKDLGIPTVALRYTLTYGPRQSLTNPYTGICSIFSTRILNNLPPVIYEDGRQTRDFLFVEDCARANLLVMKDDRADNQVFTVGTGKGTTILEFVATLAALYGKSVSPIVGEKFRPADSRHMVADISKLQQIGYQPRVGLAEGLKRYSTWILEGPRAEDSFSAALQSLENMRIVRSTRS